METRKKMNLFERKKLFLIHKKNRNNKSVILNEKDFKYKKTACYTLVAAIINFNRSLFLYLVFILILFSKEINR